jgi:spore germination protein KC
MKQWNTARGFLTVLLILSMALPLSGCYDKREIDELAYPLAIGLDVGQADTLRLTVQLAVPLEIGGGEGGGGGGGKSGGQDESGSIITIDTPSLYSGLNLINNTISKEINISHIKTIVISKKLAETDINRYLHGIERGREFRPDIFLVVSNCPAEEYLKNVKPTLESNPSKYYELLLGKKFTAFYPSTRLNDFYYENESDYRQPVAILSDVSKYESSSDLNDAGLQGTATKGVEGKYEAGNIPIVAKQKNEVMGMAVFKGGKMVGHANGAESVTYHLITGDYKYSYWTITDPLAEDRKIIMNVMQRKQPKIEIEMQGDHVVATVRLNLEGDFTAIQSGQSYEDMPELIEQTLEASIREEVIAFLKRTTEEFDSDICGFGRYVKGKFLTWQDWENYKWFDRYRNTKFNVQVDLKIRRTGLMIQTIKGTAGG